MFGGSTARTSLLRAATLTLATGLALAQEPPDQPTLRLTGRLIDEQGQPVAGARFTTGPLDALRTADALQRPVFTTGADGRYDVTIPCHPHDLLRSLPGLLAAAPGRAALRVGEHLRPFHPFVDRPGEEQRDDRDLVMPPGLDLRGRVVSPTGKPLAGVVVRAVALSALDLFFPFQPATYSAAVSGDDGRFTLPSVPDRPLALLTRGDGLYDRILYGIDPRGTALVTMRASGHVTGRLLLPDGTPVAGRIYLDYEGYNAGFRWDCQQRSTGHDTVMPCQALATAADGSFRATVRFAGHFRVHGRLPHSLIDAESEVLHAPAAAIDLKLPDVARQWLRITAVDEVSRAPVAGLRGASLWSESVVDNPRDVAWMASQSLRRAEDRGVLRLPGPRPEQLNQGMIHLVAPGYAPLVRSGVEWQAGGAALEVVLTPESSVAGTVVDGDGKPVASALVRCVAAIPEGVLNRGGLTRPYCSFATTGADGGFHIVGLGEGDHELIVEHAGFAAEAQVLELRSRAHRKGLRLQLSTPARLPGRVAALDPAIGVRIELEKQRELPPGPGGRARSRFAALGPAPVAGDGAFEVPFDGPGHYRGFLLLADGARVYWPRRVDLGELDITAATAELSFKAPDPLLASISGRVRVRGLRVPTERFVVGCEDPKRPLVANFLPDNPRNLLRRARPVRIDSEGRFRLQVRRGVYRPVVFDAVTGILLHRGAEVDVTEKVAGEANLVLQLGKTVLELKGAGGGDARCTRILVELPDQEIPEGADEGPLGAAAATRRGTSLWVGDRPGEVTLFLPPGYVQVTASWSIGWLFPDDRTLRNELGQIEFEVRAGQSERVEFVVDEPELDGGR